MIDTPRSRDVGPAAACDLDEDGGPGDGDRNGELLTWQSQRMETEVDLSEESLIRLGPLLELYGSPSPKGVSDCSSSIIIIIISSRIRLRPVGHGASSGTKPAAGQERMAARAAPCAHGPRRRNGLSPAAAALVTALALQGAAAQDCTKLCDWDSGRTGSCHVSRGYSNAVIQAYIYIYIYT